MQIDGETIFLAEKYPEIPTFSNTFGVEDFIKIHQFNEPASGTCDLIIALKAIAQTRISDLTHFSFITYVEGRRTHPQVESQQHRVLRIVAVWSSTRFSSHELPYISVYHTENHST